MDFRSKLPSLTRFQAITWIKVSLIAGLLEGAVTFAVGCMIMAFQGESHGQGLSSLALGSLSAFMSCLPLGLFSLICSGGRKNPFSEKKKNNYSSEHRTCDFLVDCTERKHCVVRVD
ncbi:MAG: hypothetical protein LIP09_08275 [Bacteroidales bacterium]|nr:hypothetical protein [Bacteroidales bacterium]